MTKNIMLEIRAGTGGDEASIWAGDLVDVFALCRTPNWKVKLVSEAEMGGFKEAILEIQGDQVYSKPKFEAGVHRVQRVPVTEAGVEFTSTATVAVMPEVDDVEIHIDPKDIEMTTARSGVLEDKTLTRWKQRLTCSTNRPAFSARKSAVSCKTKNGNANSPG